MLKNGQTTFFTNIFDILLVPVDPPKVKKQNKWDSSVKCLTFPDEPLPSYSKWTDSNKITNKISNKDIMPRKTTNRKTKKDDDWEFGVFKDSYKHDEI